MRESIVAEECGPLHYLLIETETVFPQRNIRGIPKVFKSRLVNRVVCCLHATLGRDIEACIPTYDF